MVEKISELRNKYSETIHVLEKSSLKLLNMKKIEIAKLKTDKEMQEKYGQGLDEMLRKQKSMLEKYQEQQKTMLGKKNSTSKWLPASNKEIFTHWRNSIDIFQVYFLGFQSILKFII